MTTPQQKEQFKNIIHQKQTGQNLFMLCIASIIINIFSLAVPLLSLQVYDRIITFQNTGTLQVLCAGVFVCVLLDGIIKIARTSMIQWSTANFENAAYYKTLFHLMSASLSHLQKLSPSEQLHRLSSINKLKNFYGEQSITNLIDIPFVFIFLAFTAYLSGWLALIPISLLTCFCIYTILVGKKIKTTLEEKDTIENARINFISEILTNIHTVKMLGLESAFVRRYENVQSKSTLHTFKLSILTSQSLNIANFFTQIMMISMVSCGSILVLNGYITTGILIACILLCGRIVQPVQRALSYWISYQEYLLAQKKIEDIFSIPTQNKISATKLKEPAGRLEIKNLCFAHKQSAPLFDNLNIIIEPAQTIAISGSIGEGKSTLLKLIAGLYLPQNGEILIDNTPITSFPFSKIPQYVGYLPPESEIFQGSIIDNLTGFRPELKKAALEIAKNLGIDKIVSKLSKGYDTLLFDGAADPITPGLKQRITIARVLINRPRLILFNSADKSLDKEGYNHVFRFLGKLQGQASMILVSNDRNILHLAQDEYILKDGKLSLTNQNILKPVHLVQPLKEFGL